MWKFRCGVCDVPYQSVKHIARLNELNMFPALEPYEFILLQLPRPSQEISKEDKCLKIICFYKYIFELHNFCFLFIKFTLSLL